MDALLAGKMRVGMSRFQNHLSYHTQTSFIGYGSITLLWDFLVGVGILDPDSGSSIITTFLSAGFGGS